MELLPSYPPDFDVFGCLSVINDPPVFKAMVLKLLVDYNKSLEFCNNYFCNRHKICNYSENEYFLYFNTIMVQSSQIYSFLELYKPYFNQFCISYVTDVFYTLNVELKSKGFDNLRKFEVISDAVHYFNEITSDLDFKL